MKLKIIFMSFYLTNFEKDGYYLNTFIWEIIDNGML